MLTVTYDNSDKDLPAICVMQVDENAKYKCLKMVIGEQAELLYKALTDQSFKIAELKEKDKPTCDRNICLKNEYNNIGCEDCVVTKGENNV